MNNSPETTCSLNESFIQDIEDSNNEEDDNGEEKTQESSSDMELDTQNSPPLTPISLYTNNLLGTNEITPMLMNEIFTPIPPWYVTVLPSEWIKFGEVLHELKNRNRFLRAWNAIDEAE